MKHSGPDSVLKISRGCVACSLLAVAAGRGVATAAEPAVTLEPVEVRAEPLGHEVGTGPSTTTRYGGEFLQANGVTEPGELARLTPGFFASAQSPENVSFSLRGVNSDTSDPRVQPRVSVFQDGVGLGNVQGAGVAWFDLDEAAVFKGPQATRFGAGVQSGALALASRRPEDANSAELTVGAGDRGTREAELVVNTPVVADKLFVRVAALGREDDGYMKNLAGGPDLQGGETAAARVSLRWRPTDATTADLILGVQRDDASGVDFKSGVVPVSPLSTDTDPFTPANLNRADELGSRRTIHGVTGLVRHELNDDWTLTSTSGWRRVESDHEFDADGSFLYLLEPGEAFHGRQLSQELRFSYDGGERITASAGVNVAWSDDSQTTTIRTDENALFFFLTGTPPPVALNPRYLERNRNTAETTSGDVFGRVDYKLAERLTVGGGLRLTQERLVSRYQSFAAPVPGNLVGALPTSGAGNNIFRATNGALENPAEERSWAGEVDVRREFTSRLTGFAKVSRGRRPPVLEFNELTLARQTQGEEQVWNYEAGVAGASAGRRLRYDASVFQYYFDNFQTRRVVAPGVVESFDGGRARGQGAEFAAQAEVARGLVLFATYGFTDAKFAALGEDGSAQAFAGNSFRLTSRHVVSAGGTVSVPGPRDGTVFFTPLYTYRSGFYFEDDNAQNGGSLRQPGFGVVDLRLGYRPRDARWEVEAYVTNALDEEYLLDAGNIGGAYGLPTFVPAAPRLFGVKGTVRF